MKRISLFILSSLILFGFIRFSIVQRWVEASSGCVSITVLFKDYSPVHLAWVVVTNEEQFPLGWTNTSGQVEVCGLVPPGTYVTKAYYPDINTLFASAIFTVDENGDGSHTLSGNYEITPPVIEILSPQNTTYTTTSIPLTFTVNDYSDISWMGYSLDDQPTVTITGNTTLTIGLGQHNVLVYANDTYGNMGSSDKVYFTKTGCVTIQVRYSDVYPRSDAIVKEVYNWPHIVGATNESGYVSESGYLPNTIYRFEAYWPDLGHQFGPRETIVTDEYGNGIVTIQEDYEITPPLVNITSPQNTTYSTTSVDLNYSVVDYSPISWVGYSLDGQDNETITGNTTLTGLSQGTHNIRLYANDTYSNMGSSETIYFTVAPSPVGGFWIPTNKLELLAPYIGIVSVIVSTIVVSVVYFRHRKKQQN